MQNREETQEHTQEQEWSKPSECLAVDLTCPLEGPSDLLPSNKFPFSSKSNLLPALPGTE
jgi:hypothetical protein